MPDVAFDIPEGVCYNIENEGRSPRTKGNENVKLEKAIERAFDRCNLIGEDCDIYSVLYSYKAIRELPESEIDKIYNNIAKGLGF